MVIGPQPPAEVAPRLRAASVAVMGSMHAGIRNDAVPAGRQIRVRVQ